MNRTVDRHALHPRSSRDRVDNIHGTRRLRDAERDLLAVTASHQVVGGLVAGGMRFSTFHVSGVNRIDRLHSNLVGDEQLFGHGGRGRRRRASMPSNRTPTTLFVGPGIEMSMRAGF